MTKNSCSKGEDVLNVFWFRFIRDFGPGWPGVRKVAGKDHRPGVGTTPKGTLFPTSERDWCTKGEDTENKGSDYFYDSGSPGPKETGEPRPSCVGQVVPPPSLSPVPKGSPLSHGRYFVTHPPSHRDERSRPWSSTQSHLLRNPKLTSLSGPFLITLTSPSQTPESNPVQT